MHDAFAMLVAWSAGCGLGALFFAGLRWTVLRSLSSTRPALLLLSSMLVRMAALLAGFYYVSGGDWRRSLACLAGVVTARMVLIRRVSSPAEAGRAPQP